MLSPGRKHNNSVVDCVLDMCAGSPKGAEEAEFSS